MLNQIIHFMPTDISLLSLQRLGWDFERLPKFCENWNNFYQLSIGTGSVWQTAFSLIAENFETEIVQDVGPLQKTTVEQHKY